MLRKQAYARARGQTLVEFAFASVILFFLLLAIVEGSRFLYAYNVVSNAAQEGTRYGAIRPRDVLGPSEATRVAASQTQTPAASRVGYVPDQVLASDTRCSIFSKTRDQGWGINKQDMQVTVWYARGDGTPIPTPSNYSTPYVPQATLPGNKIVVEANYQHTFLVPLLDRVAPNGIRVTMRSSRTILRWGDEPDNCTISAGPSPTPTPTP